MSVMNLLLIFLAIFVLLMGYRFIIYLLRFQRKHRDPETTDARLQAHLAMAQKDESLLETASTPRSLAIEQQVLQAMCTNPTDTGMRELGLVLLSDYAFQKTSHQQIFDALKEIPTGEPAKIRALLPAHLTRKGFPDLDCGLFLTPSEFSPEEIKEKMKSLAGLTNVE